MRNVQLMSFPTLISITKPTNFYVAPVVKKVKDKEEWILSKLQKNFRLRKKT
jgi:hypothetical protein